MLRRGKDYELQDMNKAKVENIGRLLMSASVADDLKAKLVGLN